MRTGVRWSFTLARGTTDFNLHPYAIHSDKAAEDFMQLVYKIDPQDLMTKYEGYSVTGGRIAGKQSRKNICIEW